MESEAEKLIYVSLDEVDPNDFCLLLNNKRNSTHLIEHKPFDLNAVKLWLRNKSNANSTYGCRVRGIVSYGSFAGWCGIQFDDGKYEIAIVLDSHHWGIGKRVFSDVMGWAEEIGHEEIFIHLLDSRPEYKFLRKISKNVFHSEQHGRRFTTYQLPVKKGLTNRSTVA